MSIKIGNGNINQFNIYDDSNINMDIKENRIKKSSLYETEDKEIEDINEKEEDLYDLDVQIKEQTQPTPNDCSQRLTIVTNCGSCVGTCQHSCINCGPGKFR